jgi:hypothetical protein
LFESIEYIETAEGPLLIPRPRPGIAVGGAVELVWPGAALPRVAQTRTVERASALTLSYPGRRYS